MSDEKRPPNFDWVTERHNCSLVTMFGVLKLLARRDVAKLAELAGTLKAHVEEPSGFDEFFSVVLPGNAFRDRQAVRFQLARDRIIIEDVSGQSYNITLTLDDDGRCKLKVNAGEFALDPWQVMRLALEPLLFGS